MDKKLYEQNDSEYGNYNGQPYNNGGYNNGGYNNSGYNNGGYHNADYSSQYNPYEGNNGYNNGGYNNGGYNNGGYNNSAYNDGGYNNGGYNNGGYQNYHYDNGTRYYAGSYSNELISSKVITRSFIVMLVSLLVTAFAATITAVNRSFFVSAMDSFVALAIVEIVLVIGTQIAISKRKAAIAGALYMGYTIINGVTLSAIFYAFDLGSIQEVFFITALLFGVMAGIGAVTKKDLSGIGSLCTMLLLGALLVTFINGIFLHSGGMELMMDYLVVAIFVGLTAYDTQKMKRMAAAATMEDVNVLAIYCGMELYLDFINLFLRLLKLMGNSRN